MIVQNKNSLLILQKSQFKIYDLRNNQISTVVLENNILNDQDMGFILAGCISECENYICLSDDTKHLYLYYKKDDDWCLIRKTNLDKRCCKIIFSNDMQNILVADKSGYVLRIPISFEDTKFNSDWISMGHVSVLTDFSLHPKQKLIATCDRDEKIRLSYYPDSYEIYAYLLGHSKYVAQVAFSANGKQLISAGGDGLLIIWDLINKTEVQRSVFEESEPIPPVTRMFVVDSFVFLFFHNSSFYNVFTLSHDGLVVNSAKLSLPINVLDVAIRDSSDANIIEFYVLHISDCDAKIDAFNFNSETFKSEKLEKLWLKYDLVLSQLTDRYRFLESLPKVPVDKSGVDTYYEKKEKRIKLNGDRE